MFRDKAYNSIGNFLPAKSLAVILSPERLAVILSFFYIPQLSNITFDEVFFFVRQEGEK